MASTEDFGARLERLEQRIEEMDRVESRSNADRSARVEARISPRAWLSVTGPVFAALALGFGVLWNAQQTNTSRMLELHGAANARMLEFNENTNARMLELNETTNARMLELHKSTTAHLIELTRTTARLEATSERLEAAIDRLDGSVQKLSDQVERLSDRVDRLES